MADRKSELLIVARTARPLVEMAREAGYVPHALDLFGDEDMRAAARTTTVLAPTRHFDFEPAQLFGAVSSYQALHGPLPVVCGSAFERAPAALAALTRHFKVLGCDATVYRRLLDLPALFATLRRAHGIATPDTRWQAPRAVQGWLRKQVGGSGGGHVAALRAPVPASTKYYFQRRLAGSSRSALFIGNGHEARYYGCAEHLRWHGQPGYRYEGARLLPAVPASLVLRLQHIGAVLAARLALRGCFGVDFLWHEQREPVLLDINPRPTATLELWPERQRMFDAHIAACTDRTLLYSSPRVMHQHAHLVLYADVTWQVRKDMRWPPWIADRPAAGALIPRGAPLCTVRGEAATQTALVAQMQQRYAELRTLLGATAQAVLPATIDIRSM